MERTSNEMEYEGLIEGVLWASRLHLSQLIIVGDSKLIIKQVTGEYSIRNHRLRTLHKRVHTLLDSCDGLEVVCMHIPRNDNQLADNLANDAIETRMNVTTCNWPNINKFMKNN